MIAIPIYRPEITAYQLDPDGIWDSKYGTTTATLFEPMADEDGRDIIGPGFRRVVKFGVEPFFTILAPYGTEMIRRGRANFLRTAEGKLLDATNALIIAKRRDSGFDLVRPGRPSSVARPPAPSPEPAPPRPQGPMVQMALFN